ncbi:nucleotide-binding protein [Micromonospora rifamycinica]|uniref:Predicted nucleic acid-binding protein, contains PIN domain n=1 Tax=Micromonospora rifamycinica TaxID=291594 RepID=A0A125Q1M4_9ACTN|nr:nucleotide-binding protein [Micromonospora rifamycinica]KWV32631.1 nucleotide-binding protein [Micromonospora rifamycinica]SCG63686.1 Predicted nucleic acid-binding protein, contains PIN domain [Micromonospora rifamycinica]
MTVPENALVFDTGPLRHFAKQGWLGVLRFLAEGRPVYIPDSVERELNRAVEHVAAARAVLDADWIHVHRSTDFDFIEAFAHYDDRLVADGKNLGECGVLAMGQVYKCEVVLDDATPRQIAEERGIRVTATVPLLCEAVRTKRLTMLMVEELVDHLLEGEYFLPFGVGGFRRHVLENGLLEYDELL